MGTVHEDHPTLYRASDLRVGWVVLHYPEGSPIELVERGEDRVRVRFESGHETAWAPDDHVHAQPGE